MRIVRIIRIIGIDRSRDIAEQSPASTRDVEFAQWSEGLGEHIAEVILIGNLNGFVNRFKTSLVDRDVIGASAHVVPNIVTRFIKSGTVNVVHLRLAEVGQRHHGTFRRFTGIVQNSDRSRDKHLVFKAVRPNHARLAIDTRIGDLATTRNRRSRRIRVVTTTFDKGDIVHIQTEHISAVVMADGDITGLAGKGT